MTQITLREYLRTIEDNISSGRINEAMADCQNILSYFPEALEAQHLLGEVYLAQGQLEEAQQTFEWILTNDPENVIVYCDRALISERLSDIETALDCYQQAYELSRGNQNIRQEFNQLSARAGQPEFMFSRAGLARLYMRGNLLTQAIQEWEAVLAISPERLDARLGLAETYWREGLFEKAEQIATRLVEEIPTCLKALLYLAHIASISNIARAKEFLTRAETLDPELRMAQEVFADLAASQPNDPFLTLIQCEPILLQNGIPVNRPIVRQPVEQPVLVASMASVASHDQPPMPAQAPTNTPISPVNSQVASPSSPVQPEMLTWQAQLASTAQVGQPWYENDQLAAASTKLNPLNESAALPNGNGPHSTSEEEQSAPPAWLGTLTQNEQPPVAEPRYQAPKPAPITVPAQPTPPSRTAQEDEAMPFFFSPDTENADTDSEDMGWPAWLKSLGAESLELENASEPLAPMEPVTVPSVRQEPAIHQPIPEADPWAQLPAASTSRINQPEASSQPDWMQQLATPSQETTSSSTPDWMQQLATPSQETTSSSTPDWMQQQFATPSQETTSSSTPDWMQQHLATPSQETTSSSTPDWMQQFATPSQENTSSSTPDWMQQFATPSQENTSSSTPDWMQQFATPSQENTSSSTPDWMQQFAAPSQEATSSSTPDWMQQWASPESHLETQGTTPASLNEQEQRYISSLEDLEKSLQVQGFAPLTPGTLASIAQANSAMPPQEQPSLSSALAQLGNFTQPTTAAASDEPWWNTMLSQAPEQLAPTSIGEHSMPYAGANAQLAQEVVPPLPTLPATPVPPVTAPLPPTVPFQSSTNQPSTASTPLIPTYRSDALLDSDLETTMKRPAIKLQPMRSGSGDRASSLSKGYSQERNDDESMLNYRERSVHGHQYQAVGTYDQSTLNYRERLVRGYQNQLAGAYDEAMNDYRLITKHAPELLDDVISNMRALLKLNPRFSQGYRVLGDAYMRKGEYLQAMEAYNKALTITKKAKS